MSGSWWQMDITCKPEDSDAIAAAVVTATGYGVEEPEPGRICAVASSDLDGQALARELASQFAEVTTTVTQIDPIDWSVRWRDGIVTRRFGRLVLTPSWLPVEPATNEVVLVLDPESAFGSGEHGSTRAALTLLERHLRGGDWVLDFGSGSGVLAIAAALLGASSAMGIEVDPESNPIAEANAARNGVAGEVAFLLGDAGQLGPLAGPAHLVCSNILRSVNTLLLPAIRDALRPDGLAIFSGMEAPERELFLPLLESEGWTPVDEVVDAAWWAVAARRPA